MAPTPASIQQRATAIYTAQGSVLEDHLIRAQVQDCKPHRSGTAGLSTAFVVDLGGRAEAFLKPWGGQQTPTGFQRFANINSCQLYGQDPDEVPLNEATAWRLAHRIGGPVAEIVAPCVLRTLHAYRLTGSLSGKRYGIHDTDAPFTRASQQAMAAAFFDSLIAQQDRHRGNYRWHEKPWMRVIPHRHARRLQDVLDRKGYRPLGLGLIDHGFAFARPASGSRRADYQWEGGVAFVKWRHDNHATTLSTWESNALERVLSDPEVYGLRRFLESDRCQALEARAQEMLRRGTILDPLEW